MHPLRTYQRTSQLRDAISGLLIVCLLVLPALRTAGEMHHAVAHAELPELHAHSLDAHATHVADNAADTSSMHQLMHLPGAGADTFALAYAPEPAPTRPSEALPSKALGPTDAPTTRPSVHYRPPIVA